MKKSFMLFAVTLACAAQSAHAVSLDSVSECAPGVQKEDAPTARVVGHKSYRINDKGEHLISEIIEVTPTGYTTKTFVNGEHTGSVRYTNNGNQQTWFKPDGRIDHEIDTEKPNLFFPLCVGKKWSKTYRYDKKTIDAEVTVTSFEKITLRNGKAYDAYRIESYEQIWGKNYPYRAVYWYVPSNGVVKTEGENMYSHEKKWSEAEAVDAVPR